MNLRPQHRKNCKIKARPGVPFFTSPCPIFHVPYFTSPCPIRNVHWSKYFTPPSPILKVLVSHTLRLHVPYFTTSSPSPCVQISPSTSPSAIYIHNPNIKLSGWQLHPFISKFAEGNSESAANTLLWLLHRVLRGFLAMWSLKQFLGAGSRKKRDIIKNKDFYLWIQFTFSFFSRVKL